MTGLDNLKTLATMFGRGLFREMMPGLAEGVINDYFHEWKVDADRIRQDVKNDRTLWRDVSPEQMREMRTTVQKIGSLNFITPELVIRAIRKDFPEVATLFLNWPEGQEWLVRQLDELKREVNTVS